jgi:DNA-binding beta-propeller fold protein YncE
LKLGSRDEPIAPAVDPGPARLSGHAGRHRRGGGDLIATEPDPNGVSIDPVGRRIYWADYTLKKISFVNLDGTGAGDLNSTGATMTSPLGTALDPGAGRIYWANNGAPKISFANLDGSGGGDLNTTGATVSAAWGLAVDSAGGRVYWANSSPPQGISFANIDGSGGCNLDTTGATIASPAGIAIDAPAGRIYWANDSASAPISFASLSGGGGGNLNIAGAMTSGPNQPSLLKSPAAAGPPAVTGTRVRGSVLSCSQGTWASDLLGAFLYRAPQSFAVQWSRNGSEIAGATGNTVTAKAAGTYRCTVTASNATGATSQTSSDHRVLATFGARTLVTLRLAARRISARGPLPVRLRNRNDFRVRARLSGRAGADVQASRRRTVRLKAKRFAVAARSAKTVKLRLPRALRVELLRTGRLRLRLAGRVTDPAGRARTVKRRVVPRLKR